jgi:hypothetical protein
MSPVKKASLLTKSSLFTMCNNLVGYLAASGTAEYYIP